ncbi:MAG: threonine dehydratase [Planctomycetota bacterium]|jgi:threonine dehydratase
MANDQMPDLEGIICAAQAISPYLSPTPLLRSELLSRALEADVWLKYETMTPIASFKIRGALNAVINAKQAGAEGVVTSSTGNHGQGVAYAARELSLSADIFLPSPANQVKAKMIEAFGGRVHEHGDDFDVAKLAAIEFADRRGYRFINDGEATDVMEGAGTIALEIARELAQIDLLLIPMGGGNLSGGCVTAMKALQPDARVISVQAKGSAAVTESFHQREIVERPIATIADGLVTRLPAEFAMTVLWKLLDDAWLASDDDLLAATHSLMASAHVLVEPAGAAALAGACQHRQQIKGRRVVFILTGANISSELLQRALATAPII